MDPGFDAYVGIDYSGAGRPDQPAPGIEVYVARPDLPPAREAPPDAQEWSRRDLAAWLAARLQREAERVLVGIDFAFSFPDAALRRQGVQGWRDMLARFSGQWRTHERTVAQARREVAPWGEPREKRLVDHVAAPAKSPFFFGGAGNVGYATHAGLPWLMDAAQSAFVWPFDGWRPPERASVVVEAYPSLYRRRYLDDAGAYDVATPSEHARDAHVIARYLRERDAAGVLPRLFDPPLTPRERALADVEGWILGVA